MLRQADRPSSILPDRTNPTGQRALQNPPSAHSMIRFPFAAAVASVCICLSVAAAPSALSQVPLSRDTITASLSRADFPGFVDDDESSAKKQIIWDVVVLSWSGGATQVQVEPSTISCDSAGSWLDSVSTHALVEAILRSSIEAAFDSQLVAIASCPTTTTVEVTFALCVNRIGSGSTTKFSRCAAASVVAVFESCAGDSTQRVNSSLSTTVGDCSVNCALATACEPALPVLECDQTTLH